MAGRAVFALRVTGRAEYLQYGALAIFSGCGPPEFLRQGQVMLTRRTGETLSRRSMAARALTNHPCLRVGGHGLRRADAVRGVQHQAAPTARQKS